MIIARNDKVVAPEDIIKEAEYHLLNGNKVRLVMKRGLSHGKRVIVEKVIFPNEY